MFSLLRAEERGCNGSGCHIDSAIRLLLVNVRLPCESSSLREGWGVVAAGAIEPGALVTEYVGEVVNAKKAQKRMQQYTKEGLPHTYMMSLDASGRKIDATKKGGVAR
jgi:SET domain-containing protein